MPQTEDLDTQVKQADPDRWLASRFIADAQARADVVTLYAFNHVLAGIGRAVSEPMMGQIRLAWWREALEEMFGPGPVRAHPVVEGLAEAVRRGTYRIEDLVPLVDAREVEFEPGMLVGELALERHIDATAGALAAVAAHRLDPGSPATAVRHAMRAWGWSGLARNRALPPDWTGPMVSARVKSELAAARDEVRALPVAAFPAVAYATLAPAYAAEKAPAEWAKRLRLTLATARGHL